MEEAISPSHSFKLEVSVPIPSPRRIRFQMKMCTIAAVCNELRVCFSCNLLWLSCDVGLPTQHKHETFSR
ncbi:hypothetical protein J6590_041638 [Homalodisca vitripennis]|nr:hypothetical protein J6590_041638 [Homalodisca vitripennis]